MIIYALTKERSIKIWCKNDKNVCLINILKGMYHNFIPGVLYKQRLQTVDNAVINILTSFEESVKILTVICN